MTEHMHPSLFHIFSPNKHVMGQSVTIQTLTCGADYPVQERDMRITAESLAGQDSDRITRAGRLLVPM